MAGGLSVESCGDLRLDGGLYINLSVVAARHHKKGGRGECGQEDFADHAGPCTQFWGLTNPMMTVISYRGPG